MAPTSSDPKELKLVLNPARRRALTLLVGAILTHMRSQISNSFDPSHSENTSSSHQVTPLPSPDVEAQSRLEARLERDFSTPQLRELKRAALRYFDDWRDDVQAALDKVVNAPEDPRLEPRKKEWLAARKAAPPPYSKVYQETKNPEMLNAAEDRKIEEVKEVSMLQHLYRPFPTRLNTIPKEDRVCVVSCMVLILLTLGHYSAHSRVLLCYLTSAFAVPLSVLSNEETEIARTLMLASKSLSADAEAQKRKDDNASSRRWKVGLASVAGAALVGVTGGLALPVVAGAIGGLMGGVGLGGLASFIGSFAMNGALVGTLFGAYGAAMTGQMVDNYAKEVEDFKFIPIKDEWAEFGREEDEVEQRRLRVTIGINGWLNDKDDVVQPWRVMGQDSEVFALRYEMEALISLGTSLKNMVSSYAWSIVKIEILKRTVLATLMTALWPVYLLKMATSIDNPFSIARNRSEKAGEVLADALINKAQGERPITLIGYSLGSRVIYSCLKSLAERKAFGLVESVVFIGSPVPSNSNNWRAMRSVVSGKLINVYSKNDYILAFLYRTTSIQFGIAGLQEITDVEGVENINLSKEVSGHLRYPELIGKILKRCGFEGIKVSNTEIEEEGVPQIQLIDVEEDGSKIYGDVKALNNATLVEMGSGSPEQALSVDAVTTAVAAVEMRDEDAEHSEDEVGIIMKDNDADGGLRHLSGDPEPDEPEAVLGVEQKSLRSSFK